MDMEAMLAIRAVEKGPAQETAIRALLGANHMSLVSTKKAGEP